MKRTGGGNSREINKCGGDHQKDLGKRKTRGISKPKERFSPDLKSQKRICDETLQSKTRAQKNKGKKNKIQKMLQKHLLAKKRFILKLTLLPTLLRKALHIKLQQKSNRKGATSKQNWIVC